MTATRFFLLLIAAFTGLVSPAWAQVGQLSASGYELVSGKRLSRLEWQSVYRVRIDNGGSALTGVVAQASSSDPSVIVEDGRVDVGAMAAGASVLAADTVTVRTNRSSAIDLDATLRWSFSAAPPSPDTSAPTISGVQPAASAVLEADALPLLSAQFADVGSGVNPAATTLELDGVQIAAQARISAEGFSYQATQPLAEGSHALVIRIADVAGNTADTRVTFTTRTVPEVLAREPADGFLPGGAQPVIRATYRDIGAGIDVAAVRLLFNGADVTASAQIGAGALSYAVPAALQDATHTVQLLLADRAGNVSDTSWTFGTAQPPQITDLQPRDVMLAPGARPLISANFSEAHAGIDPASVHLVVNGTDVTADAQVTADGVRYTPPEGLAAGPYTVYLDVANRSNALASAVWGFEVDVESFYSFDVTEPAGSLTVTSPEVPVTARVQSNKAAVLGVTVNGAVMALQSADDTGVLIYTGRAKLLDGENTLNFVAGFDDGGSRTVSRTVTLDGPPRVTVLSPHDKAILGLVSDSSPTDLTGNVERPVTVSGRVSKQVARVTVNQQSAVLNASGTEFTFERFFLREGMNVLTVVATDADGRVGTSTVTVSVDQTAPILTIEHPVDQHVTSAAAVDVRGVVNDAVEGMNGAPEPTVTVNGVAADVSDRYFLARTVPLRIGENVLDVVATDHLGNRRARTLRVSRIAVGSNRLSMISGNGQTGVLGAELPRPLALVALDRDGAPVADLPVSFDVLRGTGSISPTQGQVVKPDGVSAARNLVVRTDSAGRAQVWMRPGKQTGPGANLVRAQVSAEAGPLATQFAGELYFAATTQRGAVSKVLADLGIHQIAETGSVPLELLTVVVRDVSDNHLPGVPVAFTVEEGDAFFIDGNGQRASRLVLDTDRNGLTATRPQLGLTPGQVRISARALRNEGGDINDPTQLVGNATYVIQVREARDGPTNFRGFVYTDKGEPLPGVRLSAGRTSVVATTDETGAFELSNLPPGRIDLFVDGRTSSHLGQTWPSLHFEAFAVRGQDNSLAHPVYLPPLLVSQARVVGGDEDVILTIPGIEGFQMKVKANSVTFPDGSRTGTLVVSPVTADKLPMAPPTGGAEFGLPAWTVQPAGTRFDPPVEVTLPNSRAYPPGDNLPVVQWDHDLGQFVPMGRATVSEDGALLITDAGSGISKAGWGGLCVYDPDKCSKNGPPKCKLCEELDNTGECPTCKFKNDPAKDQSAGNPRIFGFDASKTGIGSVITDALKRLPVHEAFTKLKFKVDGSATPRERCCESLGDVTRYERFEVGPLIEIATPDLPIPGYSIVVPGLLEVGLFTKIKVTAGGTIRFDFSRNCSPMFSNGSGQVVMSAAVEGTLKAEVVDVAKLNAITVGGGGGVSCPVGATSLSCKGKFFVYAKSEVEMFNFKFGLVDFYRSTDQSANLPLIGFVD
jgi:large repetitive protein